MAVGWSPSVWWVWRARCYMWVNIWWSVQKITVHILVLMHLISPPHLHCYISTRRSVRYLVMDAVGGMLTAVRTPTDEELTLCEWSLFEHHVSNHHLGRSRIQTSYLHSWIIWGWGVVGVLVKKGSFFWWCAVRAIILLLKWAGGGGGSFQVFQKVWRGEIFSTYPT